MSRFLGALALVVGSGLFAQANAYEYIAPPYVVRATVLPRSMQFDPVVIRLAAESVCRSDVCDTNPLCQIAACGC